MAYWTTFAHDSSIRTADSIEFIWNAVVLRNVFNSIDYFINCEISAASIYNWFVNILHNIHIATAYLRFGPCCSKVGLQNQVVACYQAGYGAVLLFPEQDFHANGVADSIKRSLSLGNPTKFRCFIVINWAEQTNDHVRMFTKSSGWKGLQWTCNYKKMYCL